MTLDDLLTAKNLFLALTIVSSIVLILGFLNMTKVINIYGNDKLFDAQPIPPQQFNGIIAALSGVVGILIFYRLYRPSKG
jgi:uncharacterized membrane protein YphA (DoxX/SURF4 family)